MLGTSGVGQRDSGEYTDQEAVTAELLWAKRLCTSRGWPVIDVSRRSIEETAATIIQLIDAWRERQRKAAEARKAAAAQPPPPSADLVANCDQERQTARFGRCMLSSRAKYALRAVLALTEELPSGRWTSAQTIAERSDIPRKFLEAILVQLRDQGLIQSRRGPVGGHKLLKPAEDITVADVIRIIDGPIALTPCASRTQ
jgi:Rrf2 family protein